MDDWGLLVMTVLETLANVNHHIQDLIIGKPISLIF